MGLEGSIDPLMLIIAGVAGYFIGTIPFGLLLSRLAGLGDVRSIGSGNIGATNVLRTGNKAVAAATLLCDMLKGAVPVFLAILLGSPLLGMVAGLATVLGHIFPVWLNFKGGKGVATYIGVTLGLSWSLAILFCIIWLGVAAIFRISSLSALTAAAIMPLAALFIAGPELFICLTILGAILFMTHRQNIDRLLKGEESKISFSDKSGA